MCECAHDRTDSRMATEPSLQEALCSQTQETQDISTHVEMHLVKQTDGGHFSAPARNTSR
jgi:hypothetical protein